MKEPIDRDVVADDLALVDEALSWLENPPLYFGGSVVPLYVDDPAVASDAPRPTEDVDLLVSVDGVSPRQFEVALEAHGWTHDQRHHRRNAMAFLSPDGIPVDVVLAQQAGPRDWLVRARATAATMMVSTRRVFVPTPAFLVASKVQAALDNPARWAGPYSSHDLADALVILFGCRAALTSVEQAPVDLRTFLAAWARERLDTRDRVFEALLGERPRAFTARDVVALLEHLSAGSDDR